MENWKILVLALREIANQKQISITSLAEKMGKHQVTVSGFFSTKNPPTLGTLCELADLIGVKISIEGIDDNIIEKAKKRYENILLRHENIKQKNRVKVRNRVIDDIINSGRDEISNDNNNN